MLKKLLAALLALSLLCSAALAEEDQIAALEARIAELEAENAELRELLSQEESARLLAARFDGGVITVSEAKAEYDYLAYYYEQLGMDPDDHEDTIKTEVLNNLTEDAILALKAQELGVYAPSAEEEAEIRARAQASLDEMVDYYLAYQADPAKSDEENRASVLEFLAGEGTTLESLIESMTSQGWRDRLFAAVTADVQITEEDLRAYYDQAVANAEMAYTADPQSYETDRLGGAAVFWNPQGYRRVKRVLIPFSDENAARMQELTAQIEQGGDEATLSAAVAEMDAIYRSLDATVEEVQGRIAAGEDFEALIDAYGADPYLAEGGAGREDGYYVGVGSQLLDPDFVAAAMALDVPGILPSPSSAPKASTYCATRATSSPAPCPTRTFLPTRRCAPRSRKTCAPPITTKRSSNGWTRPRLSSIRKISETPFPSPAAGSAPRRAFYRRFPPCGRVGERCIMEASPEIACVQAMEARKWKRQSSNSVWKHSRRRISGWIRSASATTNTPWPTAARALPPAPRGLATCSATNMKRRRRCSGA